MTIADWMEAHPWLVVLIAILVTDALATRVRNK